MGGGDAGGGHAVGRAGYVGEADLVAELDGGGVAAVFAADAHLHAGACAAAEFFGHLHELAQRHLPHPIYPTTHHPHYPLLCAIPLIAR